MGSVVSTGIGSGLDIESLVTQLVSAEGTAKSARLTTKEAGFQAKLSAFGSFRAALDELKSALTPLKEMSSFQGRAVSVGDSKILTASAASSAVSGSYNVEVERLASAAKLTSSPVATEATVVGTGTLQLNLGGNLFSVVIDETNNTLAGIRGAINKISSNSGVTATIVNETGQGARLLLTSTKTGAANTLALTHQGGDAGLDTFVNGMTATAPQDSRIVIDGFAHESATNTVTTAVTGLTFNLLSTSATDVTTSVNITFNKSSATKAVNDFVTAYNKVVTSLKSVGSYDASTQTAGALFGDSTLRDFQAALRRELGVAVPGISSAFSTLAEVGIVSKVDGTLEVNSTKLDSFISSNFDQIGGLFANAASSGAPTEGVARRLDKLIDVYTKSNGLIDARTKGLQTSIDDIGDQREALEARLAALETRLRAQFNAMDTLVAQLKNTSNFLTQQIDTLNGSTIAAQRNS